MVGSISVIHLEELDGSILKYYIKSPKNIQNKLVECSAFHFYTTSSPSVYRLLSYPVHCSMYNKYYITI